MRRQRGPEKGLAFFLTPPFTSLSRRAVQRRVLRRHLMPPTTPSELTLLARWMTQDMQRDLTGSWLEPAPHGVSGHQLCQVASQSPACMP
jgi:hypothetical protein